MNPENLSISLTLNIKPKNLEASKCGLLVIEDVTYRALKRPC